MEDRAEYREPDKEKVFKPSLDKWYDFSKTEPKTYMFDDEKNYHTGFNWGGSYICIVEREHLEETLGAEKGEKFNSLEVCYFNTLSRSFQDQDNEFVNVLKWKPVPKEEDVY